MMPSVTRSLKRLLSRLVRDPLEPVLPALCGYPRIGEGAPKGHRLYVIGDIHGCVDLLHEKHQQIEADAETLGAPDKFTVIYLGDYIDGGPASREVIETVLSKGPRRLKKITLMGNHERMLLDFHADARKGQKWLDTLGRTTLGSYGVQAPAGQLTHNQLKKLQTSFRAALPKQHLLFLNSLPLVHISCDYAFVHAGIRPDVSIADQTPDDLLWIRKDFISSHAAHEKIIVHGHTISLRPRVRAYRIGIDTGSFVTGVLTCMVLEGNSLRFL
jgi:calcineurin-like phosphoesterase family protein